MTAPPPRALLFPAGILIAFVGAMTGVGGGLFAVPLLHVLWRFPLKEAVATSLMLVGANALAATCTELVHPQNALRPALLVALIVGTLVGNEIGFRVARRIDVRRLKQVFVVVLVVVGARIMLLPPADDPAIALSELPLGVFGALVAMLFGALGGFVAPLLGVGGGLIMVPGLLLSLPALGFNAVRAASMATSIVSAARSAWLHHGDRRVRFAEGAWLGAGAALGSIGGVLVAHGEGFEAFARPLLGSILWLIALRFAWELRRVRGPREGPR
jgi:uncharacterized protein